MANAKSVTETWCFSNVKTASVGNPNLFAGHAKREQQKKDKANEDAAATIKAMAQQLKEQSEQMAELVAQNQQLLKMLAEKS